MKPGRLLIPETGYWQRMDDRLLPEAEIIKAVLSAYEVREHTLIASNIRLSTAHTLKVLHSLVKKGFTPQAAYLCIDDWNSLDVLIKPHRGRYFQRCVPGILYGGNQ